jgi:hypothetical protein
LLAVRYLNNERIPLIVGGVVHKQIKEAELIIEDSPTRDEVIDAAELEQ